MSRFLSRLEQRFGRFAIHNLTLYIVVAHASVFVLEQLRPGLVELLMLDFERVRRGEIWRLVSFLFIPENMEPLWILVSLYFTWLCGTALEAAWGSFRFNVFYLIGMLGTMAAALILDVSMSNFYLNTTLFLAFATLFPNLEIWFAMILPVKAKWLGLLSLVYLARDFMASGLPRRLAIIVALSNYLLFCHRMLYQHLRNMLARTRRFSHLRRFQAPPREVRTCKICGKSDADPQVDMRVCTCAKCGEPTNYCLEHARNH